MKITEAKYLMHAMKSGTANNDLAEFSNEQKAILSVSNGMDSPSRYT
jgi:hypothetical protein